LIDDVLEHHSDGDTAAVAAERVIGVELGAISTDHLVELDPDRFEQA
jgi:hypothetical protein